MFFVGCAQLSYGPMRPIVIRLSLGLFSTFYLSRLAIGVAVCVWVCMCVTSKSHFHYFIIINVVLTKQSQPQSRATSCVEESSLISRCRVFAAKALFYTTYSWIESVLNIDIIIFYK